MKEHNYAVHSLQCRRFLRARECFACESAIYMLKFEKRGENGASKRNGVGVGECLTPTLRVAIFTLPNLSPLEHQRWRFQQYEYKQPAFARPKYACTAGYSSTGGMFYSTILRGNTLTPMTS